MRNSKGDTHLLNEFSWQAEANQCTVSSRGEVTGLVKDQNQIHLVSFIRRAEFELDIVTDKVIG